MSFNNEYWCIITWDVLIFTRFALILSTRAITLIRRWWFVGAFCGSPNYPIVRDVRVFLTHSSRKKYSPDDIWYIGALWQLWNIIGARVAAVRWGRHLAGMLLVRRICALQTHLWPERSKFRDQACWHTPWEAKTEISRHSNACWLYSATQKLAKLATCTPKLWNFRRKYGFFGNKVD